MYINKTAIYTKLRYIRSMKINQISKTSLEQRIRSLYLNQKLLIYNEECFVYTFN